MLIKLEAGRPTAAENQYVNLADEEALPASGGAIVSLERFKAEQSATNQPLGVRLEPDQALEELLPYISSVSVIALTFPKFRDGRAYSAAALLRERYGYTGELRAVGDVLLEQANYMARVGFDAFEPSDGTTVEQWANRIGLFRHVYQAAADGRAPAFVERDG
jgi:uncharacterized protein (DUF934 family)